jgi:hypothetical protein
LDAINNAFYNGVTSAELKDIASALPKLDTFHVKTHELGEIVTQKVTFNDDGIMVYEDNTAGPQLYYFKDVLPDKAGDACGMWYQNIVVP